MTSVPLGTQAPRISAAALRQATWAGVGALAILAAPYAVGSYGTEIAFRFLLYAALGQAWNLLAGYGGLVSLGSAAFVGTGAYVLVGLLNHTPVNIPFALLAGGIAAGILAAVVSPAMFRMRGLYFTVGTLALGEALRLFMVNESIFGGATGLVLANDPPPMKVLYYYAVAVFFVSTIVVSAYTLTRFSTSLRAVRDDEDAAAQMGVRAFSVKLAAFVVAGVLMGAAGGLQALRLGAIEPYGMFGLQWSIDILTLVIIGGMGSRVGPLVGAAFVVIVGEALADYPAVHTALTGVILIVIIRFAPRGLVGLASSLRRRGRA